MKLTLLRLLAAALSRSTVMRAVPFVEDLNASAIVPTRPLTRPASRSSFVLPLPVNWMRSPVANCGRRSRSSASILAKVAAGFVKLAGVRVQRRNVGVGVART